MDDTKSILVYLANKINKIEERDAYYRDNSNWKKLKEKQEFYYIKLAKEELQFYQREYEVSPTDEKKNKIDFYTDYIEKQKIEIKEKENRNERINF